MTEQTNATELDEIWADDLFDRRGEAELLAAYIESVASSSKYRQRLDSRAYTIAIDAPYGVGKSFFLRRLARQLERDHPVAFVDAWADDIADEPLTALAATLRTALAPFIVKSDVVRSRWNTFTDKAGKIALIAGKGLLKKGAAAIVSGAAVEAIEYVMSSAPEAVSDAAIEQFKTSGAELSDGLSQTSDIRTTAQLMDERIANFEAGREAIRDLKNSLIALISSLNRHKRKPPIVIIIDELDRCRPNYAVKLLEEVKHLFDVQGLVFIFGMNGDQLSHSVSGAYGPSFDGKDYLRRFIDRRYRLPSPTLTALLTYLMQESGITFEKLYFPKLVDDVISSAYPVVPRVISKYFDAYNFGARDVFRFVDVLKTTIAFSQLEEVKTFIMPLLVPLIICHIRGDESLSIDELNRGKLIIFSMGYYGGKSSRITAFKFAESVRKFGEMSFNELSLFRRDASSTDFVSILCDDVDLYNVSLIGKYKNIIEKVGRFDASGDYPERSSIGGAP